MQELDPHVFLHRDHQGADKQHDEAGIHQEVQQAGEAFTQCFALPQPMYQHGFETSADIIETVLGTALLP